MKGSILLVYLLFLSVLFLGVVSAGIIYQDDTFILGEISNSEIASVEGYSSCLTSLGSHVDLESDNSKNHEPSFKCFRDGDNIKIEKNAYVYDVKCTYACHKNNNFPADVKVGHVDDGTNIGTGLDCGLTIANFKKLRITGNRDRGWVSCQYDKNTGVISATYSEKGWISKCGYICVDKESSNSRNVKSHSYYEYGSDNIGSDLECAIGTTGFDGKCSNFNVKGASYNVENGDFLKGDDSGCTDGTFGYFCVDKCGNGICDANECKTAVSGKKECAQDCQYQCSDGCDNDDDDLIDFDSGTSAVIDSGSLDFHSAHSPLYYPSNQGSNIIRSSNPDYLCNVDNTCKFGIGANGIFPREISDNTKYSPGDILKISNPSGNVCGRIHPPSCKSCCCRNYVNPVTGYAGSCNLALQDSTSSSIKIGFYKSNIEGDINQLISESDFNSFVGDGIEIPDGTEYIYVYYKENELSYFDNNAAFKINFDYEIKGLPLVFEDDFSTDPNSRPDDWTPITNPIWVSTDPKYVMLADGTGESETRGLSLKKYYLNNKEWILEYDFRNEPGNDDCADGIWAYFHKNRGNYFAVEADIHKNGFDPHDGDNGNGGQTGKGGAIALLDFHPDNQGQGKHLAYSNQDIHCEDFRNRNSWGHIKIHFKDGNVKVDYDGNQIIDQDLTAGNNDFDYLVLEFKGIMGADNFKGKIDNVKLYMGLSDPQCTSDTDDSEGPDIPPQCSDDEDNDDDGKKDYCDGSNVGTCDSDCDSPDDSEFPQCSDDEDNDDDGKKDYCDGDNADTCDPNCQSPDDNTEACEPDQIIMKLETEEDSFGELFDGFLDDIAKLAWKLDRDYEFKIPDNNNYNRDWSEEFNEVWIRSLAKAKWIFVMPDGKVYLWEEETEKNLDDERNILIAELEEKYNTDPSLLANAYTSNYDIDICYDEIFGEEYVGDTPHVCDGENKVLGLKETTAALGETADSDSYSDDFDVCYGNLRCRSIDTGSCEAGEEIVASLSATTDAKISKGNDENFPVKICCKLEVTQLESAYWAYMNDEMIESIDSAGEDVIIGLKDKVKLVAVGKDFKDKNIKYTIYKACVGFFGCLGDLFTGNEVVAQTTVKGEFIWDAGKKLDDNTFSEGEYYFTAEIGELEVDSRENLDGSDNPNGILTVGPEDNDPPVAKIIFPLDRQIYFVNSPITFEQGSFDLDDEFSYSWNLGDGTVKEGDSSTLENYNFDYTYLSPGQKNIELTVTDGELSDTAKVSILVIASNYLLSYIESPAYNEEYGQNVEYDASGTYVISSEVGDDQCTKTITCLAGDCPAETKGCPSCYDANDCPIVVGGAPETPGAANYDNINFCWDFKEEVVVEGQSESGSITELCRDGDDGGLSFSITYPSSGRREVSLTASWGVGAAS